MVIEISTATKSPRRALPSPVSAAPRRHDFQTDFQNDVALSFSYAVLIPSRYYEMVDAMRVICQMLFGQCNWITISRSKDWFSIDKRKFVQNAETNQMNWFIRQWDMWFMFSLKWGFANSHCYITILRQALRHAFNTEVMSAKRMLDYTGNRCDHFSHSGSDLQLE